MSLIEKLRNLFFGNPQAKHLAVPRIETTPKLPKTPTSFKVPKPTTPKPKPKPTTSKTTTPAKVTPVVKKTLTYYVNDPLVNITKEVETPVLYDFPKFTVSNYKGSPGTTITEQRAARTAYSIWLELNWLKKIQAVTKWAASTNLLVLPEAGKDLNAYYDRKSLRFFYYPDPVTKNTVYTSESVDVVCHELGHAVLDFYQPKAWSAIAMEVWAFHEAFADCVAMLSVMQNDEALNKAISETQGDLSKINILAKLAEEVGLAVYNITKGKSGANKDCLRCAINKFTYKSPQQYPKSGSDAVITSEPHSFSRIFTGAFYDVFVMMYENYKQKGLTPLVAARTARDRAAEYLIRAVVNTPLTSKYYEAVAKTMLWVDEQRYNKEYYFRMKSIFNLRNIITATLMTQSVPPCTKDQIFIQDTSKVIKLSDHLITTQSVNNPLYNISVEIPQADLYLYDKNNNILEVVTTTDQEALDATQHMVDYLHGTGKVSTDPMTPFEIVNDKLERTYFD